MSLLARRAKSSGSPLPLSLSGMPPLPPKPGHSLGHLPSPASTLDLSSEGSWDSDSPGQGTMLTWSPPTTPSSSVEDEDEAPLSPRSLQILQRRAFSSLTESDFPYVALTSRLLTLRDSAPALCAGEAMALIEDEEAPRCWRARAGVYRAEALWKLGLGEEARRELGYARRVLEHGKKAPVASGDEGRQLMEALVGWSIYVGRMNWGDDALASLPAEPAISVALSALDLSVSV